MNVTPGVAGRALFWIAFVIWSFSLITAPMIEVGSSFLHMINLPFHEAGHIIFSPFGHYIMVAGGSLMQLLVPLICAGALLFQNRDQFGAALCVWWFGENLLDLAPYIDDARSLQLMLLGGPAAEVEGHDWEALLEPHQWLHLDHTIANAAHFIGSTVMVGALAWAAVALARPKADLPKSKSGPF
jgi:hypothetical protein